MKSLNLPAHQQQSPTAIQVYSIALSILLLGLTGYTYYTAYMHQPLTIFTHSTSTPPRSALYHCIKVLEKLPPTAQLTALTITHDHITIQGTQKDRDPLTAWLQGIAQQYTIVTSKRAHDDTFIIELSILS